MSYYIYFRMSHIAVYIHLVWGTKNHNPLLPKPQRYVLFKQIRIIAKAKNIYIMEINGHVDHVHVLISLKADQTISNIARDLKGGSSFWANNIEENLFNHKLVWAPRYYAASISKSGVPNVRRYIQNQESHHMQGSFRKECEHFIKRFGFKEVLE